jgi:hypothetical protein
MPYQRPNLSRRSSWPPTLRLSAAATVDLIEDEGGEWARDFLHGRSEFAQNFDVTSWVKKPVPTGSRGLKTEL